MSTLYVKLILGGVLAAFLGIGTASWLARGAEIDRLEAWQTTVVQAATQATVEPDAKGKRVALTVDQVPAALAGLRATKDRCEATLAGIDMTALRDKALQARLDSQLSAILDSQDQSAEGTKARLTDLLTRRATGDQAKDCEAMVADSNAAWDGWRK